jgi:hypothetical protein
MKNFQFPISNFQNKRGFALLVAIIFMSVMLTFGLALGSLGYKQEVLASSALGSQYAFYVADGVLECVLYLDQQQIPSPFEFPASDPATVPSMTCSDSTLSSSSKSWSSTRWVVRNRLSIDSGRHCADVMVSKSDIGATQIFVQGYDVPCATVASSDVNTRFSSRGLSARY